MEKFSIQQYIQEKIPLDHIQLYIVKRNVQTFFLDGARSLDQTIFFFPSLSFKFFFFFPTSDITKTKKFYDMSFTC